MIQKMNHFWQDLQEFNDEYETIFKHEIETGLNYDPKL